MPSPSVHAATRPPRAPRPKHQKVPKKTLQTNAGRLPNLQNRGWGMERYFELPSTTSLGSGKGRPNSVHNLADCTAGAGVSHVKLIAYRS
jgi:hypothetical protein